MSEQPLVKQYTKGELTVNWEPGKCIHSKICWNGLAEVFNPNRRPWVDLSAAEQQTIMKQVDQCPSGALSYSLPNGHAENQTSTLIKVAENGPLLIQGSCTVELPDGSSEQREKTTALCRCGASNNKPFCDGMHKQIEFQG